MFISYAKGFFPIIYARVKPDLQTICGHHTCVRNVLLKLVEFFLIISLSQQNSQRLNVLLIIKKGITYYLKIDYAHIYGVDDGI